MRVSIWFVAWLSVVSFIPVGLWAFRLFGSVGAMMTVGLYGVVAIALKCPKCGTRVLKTGAMWYPIPSRVCRSCGHRLNGR
jgi:hypothetical protein